MGKRNCIFIFLGLSFALIFSPQKIQADDTGIVINEVMPNPNVGGVEWIELFNATSSDLILIDYTIEDGTGTTKDLSSCGIAANSYLVLEKGSGACKFSFGLNNDGDIIILKKLGLEIDKVTYGGLAINAPIPARGESIARNPNGYDSDNDALDFVIETNPTPGAPNPEIINLPPTAPALVAPENEVTFNKGQEVEFSWVTSTDPEGQIITYDFYLSCSNNFADNKLIDSAILETNYFLEANNIIEDYGSCSQYYWKIIAFDGVLKTESAQVYSFTIFEPAYSDEVLGLINLQNALIRQAQVSSIVDGDTIKVTGLEDPLSSTIRLLFVDTPEENQPYYDEAANLTSQLLGQTIDLIISEHSDEQEDRYDRTLAVIIFQNQVFNTQLLENGLASFYDYHNDVLKKDAWMAILQQAQRDRIGLWEAASHLILSELLPNPIGDDASGEWVEIYNPADYKINLSYFLIDNYLISSGTAIASKGYLVFYRTQTGVTLNNNGDIVKLFFPGGLLLGETSYGSVKEGQSWALINNLWQWTGEITPGAANVLSTNIEDAGGEDEENLDIPFNLEPVEIKTGEFRNFENYLVTITGEVVETSGNTFYLDDGSGRAKVYIQEATDIDKPPMHKGDIFQITGIVNLYRNTWRILPRKQDDIKLIQQVQKDIEVKTSTAKKTTASTASAKKTSTSSNATARSPTSKQIASADDIGSIKIEGAKSPWWVQFFKALTGLAAVLIILLIIKIWRRRKFYQPLGGNFGDET